MKVWEGTILAIPPFSFNSTFRLLDKSVSPKLKVASKKSPYRVRGNIVTATNPAIQQDYSAEFAINGNKLTIKVEGEAKTGGKIIITSVFRKLSPQELTEIEKLKNLKP